MDEPAESERLQPAEGELTEPASTAPETDARRDAEATPPPRRRWWLWGSLALVVAVLIAATLWGMRWAGDWGQTGVLEPSGGLYFMRRVELPVPSYRQGDPQWRHDLLGPTQDTLGAAGCAITSVAMVMSYYGITTDPQQLNNFLNGNEGYTPQGWVYWEKAAELAPERVKHVYEDLASYKLIDENLMHKNPVIVKLRLPGGTTHFVVVAGKSGFDYLTRDPGAGASKGLYPLRELHSKIQGLRYYEKLK